MSTARGPVLGRLARWIVIHRRTVTVAWLVVTAAAVAAGQLAGGSFRNDLSVPGSDSQRAFDTLRDHFPEWAGDSVLIVLRAPQGVDDPPVRAGVAASLDRIARLPHVTGVQSPYGPGPRSIAGDGRTAFATVHFAERAKDVPRDVVAAVEKATTPLTALGVQVEFGGAPVQVETGPSGSEIVGLLAAMGVLLVAFGSVVGMAAPLVVAVFGLAVGISLIRLLAVVVPIGTAGPVVAAMIGLGVGIDYALLIVTRHRDGLARGLGPEASIAVALSTAGRSVLVAGSTVIVAILSLYLIGIRFVAAIGLASTITVGTTLAASITLLPAVLGFAGTGIDRWRVRLFHHPDAPGRDSGWWRWTHAIQRRPWQVFAGSLAILVTLALPVAGMRLGTADAGSNPTSSTTRRAYDLLASGFGPGFNGPLLLTAELAPGAAPADSRDALARLATTLRGTPGVKAVSPPVLNLAGDTAVVRVIPATSPQDRDTERLVRRLRDHVVPGATASVGARVFVGGPTAMGIDLADRTAERLPLFMGGVILLSFLLLMVEFRSLFVPAKAALMNLLSIGAAYGAVVAVFQWGWGSRLLGTSTGPVESFAPMMLFAVLFGLSMDYEVFLLSRVREEYTRTGDNAAAVADGIASTARVITAAASVMVIVFASFLLNDQRVVNLFGFGLAVAILVDATIVRMALVPATMALAGRANWWLPRWLDRLLPGGSTHRREPGEPHEPHDPTAQSVVARARH